MIAFFVDIFGICAFRTIPDNALCFKFITVKFNNIAVVDMYDRFVRCPSVDCAKIEIQDFLWSSFIKVSGKAFHGIDLFEFVVELVNNICQQAAFESEYAIIDISNKLLFRFWKSVGNFIGKR